MCQQPVIQWLQRQLATRSFGVAFIQDVRSWLDGRDGISVPPVEESPGSLDTLPGNAWA